MKSLGKQFITFCGVGTINTALALSIILFLSEILGVNYRIANLGGYVFGVLTGFALHRSITFKDQSHDNHKRTEFLKFTGVFILAYLVQLAGLIALVDYMQLPNSIAQILAIGIYVTINFAGNRWMTFASKESNS